mmetsp:Transcript_22279/g.31839  ORF Transcript_22279/g.31839 Transcript_22279/m.31839 type:complete len:843 (+) Transcript_22279:480-3008(+)
MKTPGASSVAGGPPLARAIGDLSELQERCSPEAASRVAGTVSWSLEHGSLHPGASSVAGGPPLARAIGDLSELQERCSPEAASSVAGTTSSVARNQLCVDEEEKGNIRGGADHITQVCALLKSLSASLNQDEAALYAAPIDATVKACAALTACQDLHCIDGSASSPPVDSGGGGGRRCSTSVQLPPSSPAFIGNISSGTVVHSQSARCDRNNSVRVSMSGTERNQLDHVRSRGDNVAPGICGGAQHEESIQVSAIKWGALQEFVGSVFHVGRDMLRQVRTSPSLQAIISTHSNLGFLSRIILFGGMLSVAPFNPCLQHLLLSMVYHLVILFHNPFQSLWSLLGFGLIILSICRVIIISSSTLIQVLQCKKHTHQLFLTVTILLIFLYMDLLHCALRAESVLVFLLSVISAMPNASDVNVIFNFNGVSSTSTGPVTIHKRNVIYRRKSRKHSFRRISSLLSSFYYVYHRPGSRPRRKPPHFFGHLVRPRRKPPHFGHLFLLPSGSDPPVSVHPHVDDFILQQDTSTEGASCFASGGESIQSINHSWTRRIRSRDKCFKLSKSKSKLYRLIIFVNVSWFSVKYLGFDLFCTMVVEFLASGSTSFILSSIQGSTSTGTGTPKQRSCHRRKEIQAFSSKSSDGFFTQPTDIDVSLPSNAVCPYPTVVSRQFCPRDKVLLGLLDDQPLSSSLWSSSSFIQDSVQSFLLPRIERSNFFGSIMSVVAVTILDSRFGSRIKKKHRLVPMTHSYLFDCKIAKFFFDHGLKQSSQTSFVSLLTTLSAVNVVILKSFAPFFATDSNPVRAIVCISLDLFSTSVVRLDAPNFATEPVNRLDFIGSLCRNRPNTR